MRKLFYLMRGVFLSPLPSSGDRTALKLLCNKSIGIARNHAPNRARARNRNPMWLAKRRATSTNRTPLTTIVRC